MPNGSQPANDGIFDVVKFTQGQVALVELPIEQPFFGEVANNGFNFSAWQFDGSAGSGFAGISNIRTAASLDRGLGPG